MQNRIMMTDSYKLSHSGMYPKGTCYMFDYMESRGGLYPITVFTGLQGMIKKYFSTPITKEEVEEAKSFAQEHAEPFPYDEWMVIVNEYNGNLPVIIKAVKEGTVVPVNNILVSIETSVEDERIFWIVSWLETFFMKIWYPINIATRSFHIKQMLIEYAYKTID